MHISLPILINYMGRRWILPSSSVVPRFAMRVIERSLSISAGLRTADFAVAVVEGRWPVILFTLMTLSLSSS
jgi:hypothetical protein